MKVFGFLTTVLWFCTFTVSTSAKEFSVGVENLDYAPFARVESGTYTGFFRELLDEFGKAKGHSFSYKPLPIKRLMNELVTDKVDFKVPDCSLWAPSLKLGKQIAYSTPITVYIDGVLVRPENKGRGYDLLKSIVSVRGFTPFPYMDDISKRSLKYDETTTLDAVINMVDSSRSGGAFLNVTVAEYFMRENMKKPGLLVYDDGLRAAKSDISVSTALYPEVIKEFNQWLAANAEWVSKLKQNHSVP